MTTSTTASSPPTGRPARRQTCSTGHACPGSPRCTRWVTLGGVLLGRDGARQAAGCWSALGSQRIEACESRAASSLGVHAISLLTSLSPSRLPPWPPAAQEVVQTGGWSSRLAAHPYVYMRWKEQHFIQGSESRLTIAGFYYIAVHRCACMGAPLGALLGLKVCECAWDGGGRQGVVATGAGLLPPTRPCQHLSGLFWGVRAVQAGSIACGVQAARQAPAPPLPATTHPPHAPPPLLQGQRGDPGAVLRPLLHPRPEAGARGAERGGGGPRVCPLRPGLKRQAARTSGGAAHWCALQVLAGGWGRARVRPLRPCLRL